MSTTCENCQSRNATKLVIIEPKWNIEIKTQKKICAECLPDIIQRNSNRSDKQISVRELTI